MGFGGGLSSLEREVRISVCDLRFCFEQSRLLRARLLACMVMLWGGVFLGAVIRARVFSVLPAAVGVGVGVGGERESVVGLGLRLELRLGSVESLDRLRPLSCRFFFFLLFFSLGMRWCVV